MIFSDAGVLLRELTEHRFKPVSIAEGPISQRSNFPIPDQSECEGNDSVRLDPFPEFLAINRSGYAVEGIGRGLQKTYRPMAFSCIFILHVATFSKLVFDSDCSNSQHTARFADVLPMCNHPSKPTELDRREPKHAFAQNCRRLLLRFSDHSYLSQASRRSHNPKIGGSNPSPATKENHGLSYMLGPFFFGRGSTKGPPALLSLSNRPGRLPLGVSDRPSPR